MITATADLYDERGEELASLALPLLDLGGVTAFEGLIRTVRCYDGAAPGERGLDNALVKAVLATPGEGAVLVVDGSGSLASALVGDLIATAAVDNGWAGVLVHGAIRDRDAVRMLPLGVKALGSNPRKSAKAGAGAIDVEIVIDGVRFAPGRRMWADADGVLVERPLDTV